MTSAKTLDPVYAASLLKFIRHLLSKSTKQELEKIFEEEDVFGNLLQLTRTLLFTTLWAEKEAEKQAITSKKKKPKKKQDKYMVQAQEPYVKGVLDEILQFLEFVMSVDKNLIRVFLRTSDAREVLKFAMMQYTSDSSDLANRIRKIIKTCFKNREFKPG